MTDEVPLSEEMEKAIGAAIEQVMREGNQSFVVKWVAAVEVVDPEGERGIWSFVSPDAKRWDVQGMLKDLSDFQTAHRIAEILEDHREHGA